MYLLLILIGSSLLFLSGWIVFSVRKISGYHFQTTDLERIREEMSEGGSIDRIEHNLPGALDQLNLRKDLLKAYLFLYPENTGSEKARSHVYWIIEHVPQVDGEWFEWQMHFSGCGIDEKKKLVDMFEAALKQSIRGNRNDILKNAAFFFGSLDERYALNCLDKLGRFNRLDPEIYYKIASICGHRYLFSGRQKDSGEKAQRALQALFRIPWSEKNYVKIWRLGQSHPYFINKYIKYFLLTVMSLWAWRPAWNDCSLLSFSLNISLALRDDTFSKAVYARINSVYINKFDALSLEERLSLYSVIARYQIRAGHIEEAKSFFEKIFKIPIDEEHLYYTTSFLILEELVSCEELELAKRFLDDVVRFHGPRDEVLRDLKKLVS